ncbi:carbohydrate-binding protein [Achlya hypogyna]|uniref:Carbohydrate-binding protein n=1 Tax=Achlya hypogyna TaxID=1202772 RepID=A0A0A7CP35_ACHHY|nr:secreted protein [Achlya hypogyna]OQR84980.1 carbohydrate-binding protein [Achlya hypogyna]
MLVRGIALLALAGILPQVVTGLFLNASSQSSTLCTPLETDVDYPGNDIVSTSRSSPDECCADCAATPRCVVYVWNSMTSKCFLKHRVGQQIAYVGAKAAKLQSTSSPFCDLVKENVYYPGNDLSWSLQSRAEDCCDDCRRTPGCRGFVWGPEDYGRCYLKRLLGDPVPKAGYRSAGVIKPPQTCATELDVDYYGNDIVSIPRASPDACCADCDATPNCIAYVWSEYSGRGLCNLKHTKGPTSVATGAVAGVKSSGSAATCGELEADTSYDGVEITSTLRQAPSACCQDCADTPACTFFVWSSGTCSLRKDQGSKVTAPGAVASTLRRPPPPKPTTQQPGVSFVQARTVGTYPLPTLAFSVLPQVRWLENSAYRKFVAEFDLVMTNASLQGHHAGQPHELRLGDTLVSYFPLVASAGECATVAATYSFSLFTFAPASKLCILHNFGTMAPTGETWMATGGGSFAQHPQQTFPVGFTAQTSAANLDACKAACTGACAGVNFLTTGDCILVMPPRSTDDDADGVVGGWVLDSLRWTDVPNGVQFATMTDRDVSSKVVVGTGVENVERCVALITAQPNTKNAIFVYDAPARKCYAVPTSVAALSELRLVNYPTTPLVLSKQTLRGVDAVQLLDATSATDCHRRCIPSQTNCFASAYHAQQTGVCTLYVSTYRAGSTVGVVAARALLPSGPPSRNKTAIFLTAHQDDHELFIPAQVHAALSDPSTTVVFIYMSAGDAGRTDGWYQAREAGTVAATQAWVQTFGLYHPVRQTSEVNILGHVITKVVVGNAIHYFLRLPEWPLIDLLTAPRAVSPLDRPSETYASKEDVAAVLLRLVQLEAKGRATLHSQQFEFVDHQLHSMAGKLIANAVAGDKVLSECLSQAYYWGYQHWLDPVNILDPFVFEGQRRAWLALSSAVMRLYPWQSPWVDHISVLGREYIASSIPRTPLCPS